MVECITMSAPSASGRCSSGVAKVLSTTTIAPDARPIPARLAMSLIFINGFDGVSIHSIDTGVAHAARTASRSPMSTTLATMPRSGRYSWNNMRRPL